jgi:hypothetical protein
MRFFKKGKSSKRKELDNILQERVENLEKRVQNLELKVEGILEAIKHGRITELIQEPEEKHDLKNQVEDNKSGLSDSPPEKLNGNDSEMDAHQVDIVEDCVVTVETCEVTVETVFGCVQGVNGQEKKTEQIGETYTFFHYFTFYHIHFHSIASSSFK